MSSTLYRKYRPTRWSDIAGQNHVKVTLAFEVATGKVAHAYLFSGPRGIGKTTTARILAKAVNCSSVGKEGEPCDECASCKLVSDGTTLDVIEIDAASHRGIDAVKENIIENARFSPSKLKRKVFIIDEVHMMTVEAFNALLKTLEEPPEGVMFILATTELHKVPATIISRCQRFDFRKIPFADMVERLHELCDDEKCKVDSKVLEEIARHSEGCLRDAEGLLGKVLSVGDGKRISYDQALVVMPRSDYALAAQFVDALLRKESRIALQTVGDCLDQGVDLDGFAAEVTEIMRKVLLTAMSGNPDAFAADLDEDRKQALSAWARLEEPAFIVRAVEILMEKQREMKHATPLQLPLELAAVMICEGIRPLSAAGAGKTISQAPVVRSAPTPSSSARPTAPKPTSAPSVEAEIEAAVDGMLAPALLDQGPAVPVIARVAVVRQEVPLEGVVPVHRVRELWGDLIAKAGEMSHSLTFLLSSAEPEEVVGDTIRIGFRFPFHRDKLNQDKVRSTVETACRGVFGTAMRVEGVLLERSADIGHSGTVATASLGRSAAQKASSAGGSSAADLAAAFGGKVLE